jgi:hypothetical protein
MKRQMPKTTKPKYKWPDFIKPQLKTLQQRREYLDRPSVKRWIKRNAAGLRVLDIRYFWCTSPEIIELTEVYHQVKTPRGAKVIKVKLVCGDPPPLWRKLVRL